MEIKKAEFITSAVKNSGLPEHDGAEFMFCGRSNVGKSSFINILTNRKKLAHTSSNPGKTQTLNVYQINDSFYFIDVPGYGYAAVDKKTQAKFGMMIEEYLEKRDELKRVFMLIDYRIKPTEDDLLMYNFLKYYNLPVTVIATKADKVPGSKKQKNLKVILDTLDLVVGDDLVVFSSTTKLGVKEVVKKIEDLVSESEETI